MTGSARKALLVLCAALVLVGSPAAVGQVSDLYLTDYSSSATWVVRGGQVVRQFNRSGSGQDTGCAILATLRCVGTFNGNVGREYELAGTPLAGTYANAGWDSLYDAATDGTRNWSVAHNDSDTGYALVEADTAWGGIHVLFTPARRSSGVAWDPETSSLWITNNAGGSDRIQRVDLAGNVQFEFDAVHDGGGYGLALDPADGTLWLPGAFETRGQLFQYSRTGTLLQTLSIPALGDVVGAEFGGTGLAGERAIPTLGGASLAGFALLMAAAGALAAKGTPRG